MSAVTFVGAWDPNQPRDDAGRWTGIGYHGTSRANLEGILKRGIVADDGPNVYLTDSKFRAEAFAKLNSRYDAGEAVVIEVRVPEDRIVDFGSTRSRLGDMHYNLSGDIPKEWISAVHTIKLKPRTLLSFIGAEGAWDESKHPRVPAGSEDGGQFTSAGRDFTDSELRQQVEAASARTQAFGFHPEHVADLSKMKPADRVAFIKAYGEMAANPTLFYSNLRFSGARMRAYDAFFAEMKNDPARLLERGLAEGFYSRTREGEFTYAIGNSRPFRDALGGLDAGGRDEFEREFVAAFRDGGRGFEIDDTAALHEAGWSSAELERFADRVQAAGGSYTKWSKETDYAAIHNLAGRLAFYSQDYENFRGSVFSGWALTGGSDTAVTLRRAAEEAFPSPSGDFYRVKPNRGNPAVEALYSPRAVENIRALKAETEAFYRAKFKGKDPAGKPLEVHRGIGGHVEAYTPGSIESWTRDIRTVSKFGKMMSNQAGEHSALRTTVNYNDVLWSYESAAGKHGWPPEKDLKGKKEFVVIGQRVGFVEREKR